jgi:hypothetical protein
VHFELSTFNVQLHRPGSIPDAAQFKRQDPGSANRP